MILFSLKKIENKLKSGGITDKDGMYYLMANTVLYSLCSYIATRTDKTGWWFYAEVVCVIGITILGIFKSYDINKKGDGLEYFKRFQVLNLIIGLRLIVLVTILMLVVAVIFYKQSELLTTPISMFIIVSSVMVVFYYNLCESFKRISHDKG